MAHHLRAHGVRPEMRVAVALERSIKMLAALLGILKAGGAYLPLDVQYPESRLAFMLEESESSVLITEEVIRSKFDPAKHVEVICLDRDLKTIELQSGDNVLNTVFTDNLAYVIYTSGSTGKPKGVAITHRGACSLLHWAMQEFSQAEIAGVLASTSISFDLSVFEMFVPLVAGGKVVISANALELSEQTWEWPITLINTVPSAMTELLRLKAVPKSVRVVNLAGEPLTRTLIESSYAEPQIQRVLNLYGPTEYTTYTTCGQMPRTSGKVSIGRPLPNTAVYIFDSALEPVPPGVVGEIYIGGPGLARGYLNQPDLTAERFLPDPFSDLPGARLYRTGDVARHLSNDEIEFLGRIDHQVKIRGYRIELSEIESILREHPDVKDAVVISRSNRAGNPQLVAYTIAAREPVSTAELINYLRQKLPEYMVPREIVVLDQFPLTPNGKLDRAALPEPAARSREENHEPRTDLERTLAHIWADVLGKERIGIEANFFELGGHSLIATQVVSRIEEELQVKLPIRCLFDSPTIARLAQTVSEYKATQVGANGVDDHGGELLSMLDQLSDAEVDFLYADMLARQSEAE
jgi:amino acid adenylation domain-containing protein